MRLSGRALVVVTVAAAALAALWWMGEANTALPAEHPAKPANAPPGSVDFAQRDAVDGARIDRRPPLPPPGTVLSELWTSLAPAARAGHAPSACRLAIDTLACESLAGIRDPFARLPEAPADGELGALQAFIADPAGVLAEIHDGASAAKASDPGNAQRMEAFEASILRICGERSTQRRGEALELLRQAALAGIPDAQTAYVSWGNGGYGMLPGAMAEPVFERWLQEAPTVLFRMLDAGHPEAPALLSEAYGRDAYHGFLFPFDPMRAVAYAQLARRIWGSGSLASGMLEERQAALPAELRLQADRLAEQLYREHYAGRPAPSGDPSWHRFGSVHLGLGPAPAALRTRCAVSTVGAALP